ncbi:glycosyltransferase family 2 protein [Paenibacillus sacheonensis]|uniref:Glycosyltransferase n=1 Tax=Paenibacillus sacheonensis TaxID=742054 RepID=A0A7X5C0A5_9BACL|nr:glycosyltransferase family 2 protein [Paenibacillus sacheonensis]MBM7566900.1 glycosyltransferase involved in cell wall biosynthesis [Paenibacillus sacheonensis]NBC71522.1 glycosyltransferase [Paenibacillus sacheonensis]
MQQQRNSDILVIIPAYNEEATLARTVHELKRHTPYDFVVIDDGSTDRTPDIIRKEGFPSLRHAVNLGIGGSMQSGYKYAARGGYTYAIQLDADGQHRPEDIEKLVREIGSSGCDMVIGSRFVEKSSYRGSLSRRLGILYFHQLIRLLTGIPVHDPTSGFRIVGRAAIEQFARHYPTDYPEVEVLVSLSKRGFRMKEISVEMRSRQGGTSSINWSKSIYYMMKVTLFSLIRKSFS